MQEETHHELVRALRAHPDDDARWLELARRVARGAPLPELPAELAALPRLLALWETRPGTRELEPLALALLGLEALDAPAPPGRAWPPGSTFDPDRGLPLRARRRADGAEMLWIPPGTLSRGEGLSPLPTRGLYIDRFPVTVRAYARYLEATGERSPKAWPSQLHRPRRPVVHVRLDEASAYGKHVGARLPSGEEWERAARGDGDARFPWGDAPPTAELANHAALGDPPRPSHHWGRHLQEVGRHPGGASPFGVEDLAGNVFEWCFRSGVGLAAPGSEVPLPPALPPRPHECRGGSWMSPPQELAVGTRGAYYHPFRAQWLGFRLVVPVPEPWRPPPGSAPGRRPARPSRPPHEDPLVR